MSMAMAYGMKKRAKKCMADGGQVSAPEMEDKPSDSPMQEDADMIARIMHKRREYSEGGMVANETPPEADCMPAEYDDLALRDDLESSYDAANSGDEDGSKLNQEEDAVSRVMKKRKK